MLLLLRCKVKALTVHGHAHCRALLEAAQLALVAGDLVDDAAAVVLAGVGRVEVLLDGPAEETLQQTGGLTPNAPKHAEMSPVDLRRRVSAHVEI